MTADERERAAKYYEATATKVPEAHRAQFRDFAALLRKSDPRAVELAKWMFDDWSFGGKIPEPEWRS